MKETTDRSIEKINNAIEKQNEKRKHVNGKHGQKKVFA